ncbi:MULTISPECIES: GntR family transcriptional regulator [Maribacter]|uniref:DNA-binding transcriptional regulator, GntR family n=2 Tax=Flavobacteriaceae TaxID=49546 RepID=A0A1H4S6K2_9FLAO|nr:MULTISPECIES: GntR family transcriptional regulator [Maribacter]MBU2902021.1 GntR family transcriptional regulator [Maribacter dokdonensis]CAG2532527.1 DNA-binding transcriptional regulator [Maribacter dokdonensis]SEC39720.1 DNA-binding transcriptional regulator, GntR family [Maribacter dokdonensis]HAF79145.1 GntR family transcriptional regulator [Maribacter sp.]|tara:strand:- start:342 stop:971 length:630 start_codon:yes stop_codon:yes gene_type:complete
MIVRMNLRDQVRDYLLSEMITGNLKTGKTINLAALSRHLKVSVTPIREALTQLQQSRIIKAVPNRGFIIAELDVEEAEDLYELVANLEVMAIENSEFNEEHIIKLKAQQEVFENATNALDRIQADLEFHRLLTKGYKNELALKILNDLKTRLFFYEHAFTNDDFFYNKSDNQHEAIISAIADDNVPTASLLLKMNWMLILNYIQKKLTE